jgi:D-ribulokinase
VETEFSCQQSRESIWLGLDLGTQSVRAVAVSETGRVLGSSWSPLTSRREGPRHEQDPEEWWRAVVSACRAALADLPVKSMRGVAVDGTSGTILPVDRSGRALTSALMYDDTRATDEARCANAVGGAVWASLGYRMQPSWALAKLLWLLRQQRGVVAGARVGHQTDFINSHLAGREVPSDSSKRTQDGIRFNPGSVAARRSRRSRCA